MGYPSRTRGLGAATPQVRCLPLVCVLATAPVVVGIPPGAAAGPRAAAASLEAAGREVVVTATPAEIELGGAGPQEARLLVRVRDPRALVADADLVVSSTAGSVVDLTEVAPGEFTATLLRPAESFPQLAVVTAADVSPVARGEPPCVGSAVVAFSARIELTGRTESGARMQVEIAGRRFGPVKSGAGGAFAIPVVVPPGENWARGLSTDSIGNASRSRINLYLPEVQRVHGFVFPPVLVADGADTAWIFVSTVSPAGAPERARVLVKAERGELGATEQLGGGIVRVTYRAPTGIGDGRDTLRITRSGLAAATALDVQLVAGAPARVGVTVLPDPIPADGRTQGELRVEVIDAFGSLAAGHAVALLFDGAPLAAEQVEPGRLRALLAARDRLGTAALSVRVEPATELCRRGLLVTHDGGRQVVDARGVPCRGKLQVLEAGDKLIAAGELGPNGALVLPEAALAAVQQGARLELDDAMPRRIAVVGVTVPAAPLSVIAPLEVTTTVRWRLAAPLELRLFEMSRTQAAVLLRVEAELAESLAERVQVSTSSGALRVVGSEPGSLVLQLSGATLPADVVATDTQTGVAAWLRVEGR